MDGGICEYALCVYRGQRSTLVVFLNQTPPCSVRYEPPCLSIMLKFSKAGCPTSYRDPPAPCYLALGLQVQATTLDLLKGGFGDSNLRPPACMACTLSTKSSSQTPVHIFCPWLKSQHNCELYQSPLRKTESLLPGGNGMLELLKSQV